MALKARLRLPGDARIISWASLFPYRRKTGSINAVTQAETAGAKLVEVWFHTDDHAALLGIHKNTDGADERDPALG